MNKFRKMAYAAATVGLTAPVAVLAQYTGVEQVDPGTGLPQTSIGEIINTALLWILSILAILAVIMIVIAGLMYIISGGDEGRIETAKKMLTYAIIGLIVALLGLILVNLVGAIVGGDQATL